MNNFQSVKCKNYSQETQAINTLTSQTQTQTQVRYRQETDK